MEDKNSGGSCSIRRRSLSLSSHRSHNTDNDNDNDCESVSEAGDIGDRALPSRRFSESNSFRSENGSFNHHVGNSISQEHKLLHPNSSVLPLPQSLSSSSLPLSTDAIVGSQDSKFVKVSSLFKTNYHI